MLIIRSCDWITSCHGFTKSACTTALKLHMRCLAMFVIACIAPAVHNVGDRVRVLNTCDENAFQTGIVTAIENRNQTCTVRMDKGGMTKQPEEKLRREEQIRERQNDIYLLLTGPFKAGARVQVTWNQSRYFSEIGEFEGYHTVLGFKKAIVTMECVEMERTLTGTDIAFRNKKTVVFDLADIAKVRIK